MWMNPFHKAIFLEDGIDVWNELKERFSQGGFIRISEMQCKMFALNQDSSPVSKFFTPLKVLQELEEFFLIHVCLCPQCCVCNTGLSNSKLQHEVTCSIRFFTGLNDTSDLVHSQVLLMNPLPNINKIFSMVLQHERQFKILASHDSKILINAANYRRSMGRQCGNDSTPFGTKKIAHIVAKLATQLAHATRSMDFHLT